jgi:acetoin utilization protein AcuB
MARGSQTIAAMQHVADVMSRRLVTASPETTVREAENLMGTKDIHHLIVIDDDDLRGILCACDLKGRAPSAPISRIMSAPVTTISAAATISEAADTLKSHGIGCLAVVSGGLLLGLITRTDLRRAGVPLDQLATRFCPSCRSDHDLVMDGDEGVTFCIDCLERSHPAPDEELGQPAD